MFQYVLESFEAQGIEAANGTIVDASITSAPSSTKNKDGKRDPDMHQTKKGNQLFFGMNAHIGVDSRTKIIPAVAATAANVHDATCLPDLMTHRRTRRQGEVDDVERSKNTTKSRARAKVEHPFLVIKRIFGFAKTSYRVLKKNAHRLFVTCALTNLYLMRRLLICAFD